MSPPLKNALEKKAITINDYVAEIENAYKAQSKMRRIPAERRAELMHHVVDAILDRTFKQSPEAAATISCKRGCSHCCHQDVAVTWDEAVLLIEKSESIDWEKLKTRIGGISDMPHADRACVFLKDGECSVYDSRPAACRKYFVKSEPEKCDAGKHPKGSVDVLNALKAEMFSSAMMTVQESGPMAEMLILVRHKKYKQETL